MEENEEQIYQILYSSSFIAEISDEAIKKLLMRSRKKNLERNITGILLYHQGNIIQLLEGPKAAVESLYEVISQDPRHKQIMKLLFGFVDQRDFPDWSMGFSSISPPATDEEASGLNDLLNSNYPSSKNSQEISRRIKILIEAFKRSSGLARDGLPAVVVG